MNSYQSHSEHEIHSEKRATFELALLKTHLSSQKPNPYNQAKTDLRVRVVLQKKEWQIHKVYLAIRHIDKDTTVSQKNQTPIFKSEKKNQNQALKAL